MEIIKFWLHFAFIFDLERCFSILVWPKIPVCETSTCHVANAMRVCRHLSRLYCHRRSCRQVTLLLQCPCSIPCNSFTLLYACVKIIIVTVVVSICCGSRATSLFTFSRICMKHRTAKLELRWQNMDVLCWCWVQFRTFSRQCWGRSAPW